MAIKFQYNKTALNNLSKQLKMRQKALPTLQNKESALRLEVRKAKEQAESLLKDLDSALARYDYLAALWNEFEPGLIAITDIDLVTVKVAGVKTPHLDGIHYELRPFNAFVKPAWYADGVAILKELARSNGIWRTRKTFPRLPRKLSRAVMRLKKRRKSYDR